MSNINGANVSNVINKNKKYFDENIRSLSEREVIWLQAYFTKNINVSFMSMGSTNLHEELINQLAKTDNFEKAIHEAFSKMSYSLVPDRYFQELKDSLRAQIFTLSVLISDYDYIVEKNNTDNTINNIYRFFDRMENNDTASNKTIFLNDIVIIFKRIFSNENYSKWLKSEEEQLVWVANYLNEKKLKVDVSNTAFSEIELRSIVLASLDIIDRPKSIEIRDRCYSYKVSANKELIIDKMKRAWSQQKYRDTGKTKKPYHLPLTKNTKSRLVKMAQVQGLSETAMLDILINRFYELDYVDVDGKDLY